MLTTATQQRNSQGEPHLISIETSTIAPIIDAARMFTARIKRISTIFIMSVLMVFLTACGGGTPEAEPSTPEAEPSTPEVEPSTPISVSNLRVFPDVSSAILMWDNPDADIANISISYKLSTVNNFGTPITITDSPTIARNETDVMGMIPVNSLTTPNANYTFSVTLELEGADENKSVAAAEITRLIGPNLDGDEYADADPLETDIDGDNVNNTMDAFPRNDALSAFAVTELRAAAGDESVTLKWNNPDANISSISISYHNTNTPNDLQPRPSITDIPRTAPGARNVEETITELTNGQSYNFTVSLILRDTDASKEVEAQSISATATANPFAVTGLYGVSGADYVTLGWTNPDAEIDGISISYQRRDSDNPETPLLIADDPKRAANASVQHNISGLMPDRYYDFTVSVRSGGSDEDGEGAPSISVLVNPDYDGDGKNNFVDVDADGDGLIEIATAQQLNQSRHNLQGSNFTRSAGGVGDDNGCGNGTIVGEDVTACNGYELIADISLTTYANWQPIGRCMNYDPDAFMCTPATEFLNAIFDGNNRTINDLTITNHDGSYDNASGLFGAISSTSVLRNIHIRSANLIGGGLNVGLLVGYAKGASIINSSAEGAVTASGDNVGGLVGFGDNAEITSSYAAGGAVSGGDNVGGLVGGGFDSTITSSYAAGGDVSGGDNVGGLIGLGRSSIITSSYAAGGSVSGGDEVGGLVGDGFGGSTIITSSYAAGGAVSGTGDVGGLVGTGSGSVITFSYWDSDKSGQPSDSDDSLGVNKTTQELKTPTENDPGIYSTWASDMCADGTTRTWDFGTSSDYPALRCTPNGLPAQQHLRQR